MKGTLDTIELFIDELNIRNGIYALSFVKTPAIEENFIALSEQKVEFKAVDGDKRIIIGYALVPDKKILRAKGDYKFNVIFSKDTVKQASHLYLSKLKANNTTVDHLEKVDGVSVVESWVVDDIKNDKVNLYGLNPIEGAWAVVMKVNNDEVWNDIKEGNYLGLSIEGIFSDRPLKMSALTDVLEIAEKNVEDMTEEEALGILDIMREMLKEEE